MSTEVLPEIINLFEIAKSIISKSEEQHKIKQKEFDTFIKDKETYLNNLIELNKKLEEEKKDFLKVSFVNKWRKENEDVKNKYDSLISSHEDLTKTNKNLNFVLDKMTQEKIKLLEDRENRKLVDASTQCDLIHIKTSKGIYTLKENILFSHAGKEIGNIVSSE